MKQQNALKLHESKEAQLRLDNLLLACFSVQKMYGRQPENIEVINQVFHNILGKYPSGIALKAFEVWMERSQEFPTPADIVNLIKRNGKPPLSKEIYIAINRKDPEDRNGNDWAYLREYEEQAHDEVFGSDFIDEKKQEINISEGQRLRSEIITLRDENERLAKLLHEARMAKGIEKPKPTHEQKIKDTIAYMKQTGAGDDDVQAFIASQGLPISYVVN